MNISLKNLGHIKEANNIKLNKFNVYIGKNGSGKTYFSKLTYYLSDVDFILPIYKKFFTKKIQNVFDNDLNEIIYTRDEVLKFFKELENTIKKQFSSKLGLSNNYFKNFSIKIDNDTLDDMNLIISFIKPTKKDFFMYEYHANFHFMYKFIGNLNCHYLPAARANYMITYKYLVDSLITNIGSSHLINKKENNILPDIELKFLREIFKVDTKTHGQYAKYANLIEKDIFKNGKLSISNPKTQDLPTYKYRLTNEKENIDLVATSSGVTELSPLIMYLRHKVILERYNERIIIDEPELSLHPEAQNKLVEILVKLCNDGLNITLVTHSPFILEALNNHLLRDKIYNQKLSKEIKAIPGISSNDVSAYLFEDNTIKNILDKDIKLIDDKLIDSFEDINVDYQKMRDIEFLDD